MLSRIVYWLSRHYPETIIVLGVIVVVSNLRPDAIVGVFLMLVGFGLYVRDLREEYGGE